MDIQLGYLITNVIVITTVLIVPLVLVYFKWSYKYWKSKGLPYLEPSIPFGNTENPMKRKSTLAQRMVRYYQTFKQRGHKHGGVYFVTRPAYIPVDPEYVKNILSTGSQHFIDRGVYYNEKSDPISAHLFAIGGQKWKNLRAKLTPTFTSGKMKMMFPILIECGKPMLTFIEKNSEEKKAVNIKQVMSAFTTDVIGSCAFGLDCNSFTNTDNEFVRYSRRLFNPTKFETLKAFFTMTCRRLAVLFDICSIPKDVSSFFMKVVRETAEYREKNKITRNDFMQLLLDLKNKDSTGLGKLTIEEISAQAFVFFLAGYETSSTTLTYCLHELAHNPDIQEKVRNELFAVLKRHDGVLTYDAITEMKYMNQVVEETLRKYPPLVTIFRVCNESYHVPDTDVIIDKGTIVFIPAYAIHHDPENYPDPDVFDPDRFSEENKAKRHPFTYLPFGEGPRNCIGLRFGMMETKVGLSLILQNYLVSPCEGSTSHIEFAKYTFVLTPKETIYLNLKKLSV